MKILLVNKFLYLRGGDCIHTLNLGQMLRKMGHTVRFYAMDHSKNIENENRFFMQKKLIFLLLSYLVNLKLPDVSYGEQE